MPSVSVFLSPVNHLTRLFKSLKWMKLYHMYSKMIHVVIQSPCKVKAKNTAPLLFYPGLSCLLVWYSFSEYLCSNWTPCVCWPSLIFPQQCLDLVRRCALRRSTKTKQTGLREHVCGSRVQHSHTGLKEDSYLDGERATFPWNELLEDESLVWAPQMTHDLVCICAGGSPDPWFSASLLRSWGVMLGWPDEPTIMPLGVLLLG